MADVRVPAPSAHAGGALAAVFAAVLAAGLPAAAQQRPAPAGAPAPAALAAAEEAAAAAPVAAPARTTPRPLRSVRFAGSGGLLPAADLVAIEAAHAGRPANAATAQAIAGAVAAAYAQRGFGLAGAEVARIDPAAGRIEIALIEPRLGDVASAAPAVVSTAYLAWRLGLAPGAPVTTAALATALTALSLDDDLRIDAEFRPGVQPGAVDLHVGFPDLRPRGGSLTLDSDGKPSTGRMRAGLVHGWRALTGWGDPLTVSLTLTERSGTAALAYSRPLARDGLRANIAFDAARSRTAAAPVVTNRVRGGEAGLLLPLTRTATGRLSLSFAAVGFRETGTVAGAPLIDQRGRGLRLGLALQRIGPGWFLAAGGTLTALRWDDAIAAEDGLGFRALALNAAGARQVAPGLVLALQAAAQFSGGSRAPARYRFTVAGPGGVRGHGADMPGSDRGYWLRLQLEAAEPLGAGGLDWRPYVFADTGRGWDRLGAGYASTPRRAAAGLGATVGAGSRALVDVHVARPLIRDPVLPATSGTELRLAMSFRL